MGDEGASASITLTQEMLQSMISTAVMAATSAMGRNNSAMQSKAEKPKRPTISAGTSLEKWSYFKSRWDRYKQLTRK